MSSFAELPGYSVSLSHIAQKKAIQRIKIEVYSRSPRALGSGRMDWHILNEDMNTNGHAESLDKADNPWDTVE